MADSIINQFSCWAEITAEKRIDLVSDTYQAIQTEELKNFPVNKITEVIKRLLSFYSDASTKSTAQITSILTYLLNLLPSGFSLNLENSNIDNQSVQAIAAALVTATLPPGFSLNLKHNLIGDKGAQTIVEALGNATLPLGFSLNLCNNLIGAAGAKAIAEALGKITLLPEFSLNLERNHIGDQGAQAIAAALVKVTLPPGFSLSLENNVIGVTGAKAIAAALIKVTLPPGFSLNLRYNTIGATGAKAFVDVLCLNPDICIIHDRFDHYNKVNKELLNFIKGKNTDLFQEEKRKAVTEEILGLLAQHPKSILNLIKWLTKKTTTKNLSSLAEYEVLSVIIHDLLIKPEVEPYRQEIIQLTQNTWLQSTPIKTIELAEDNELTTLAQTFLTKHNETITQLFNQEEDSNLCNTLCATFLGLNGDFSGDNITEAIANKAIQRFVNLARVPQQNGIQSPNTAVLEKDLIDLQEAMLSRLYPEDFSPWDNLSSEQQSQAGAITRFGLYLEPAAPNKELLEIGDACYQGKHEP